LIQVNRRYSALMSPAHVARILVLYATIEGHTARIAERVAGALRSHEAVVVGASMHYGHHPADLGALLRKNRAALAAWPSAFFSVSLSAKERFLREVGPSREP
jgi:menaquinone-dependent protoporphyrinogen oxidase